MYSVYIVGVTKEMVMKERMVRDVHDIGASVYAMVNGERLPGYVVQLSELEQTCAVKFYGVDKCQRFRIDEVAIRPAR